VELRQSSDAEPAGDVEAFLADLLSVTRQHGAITFAFLRENSDPFGFVQIYRPGHGQILIHRLWAIDPGHGGGSQMLRTLCELADRHHVQIALTPLPFGPKPPPMSVEELNIWYHRHGFAGQSKRLIRKPAPGPRVQVQPKENETRPLALPINATMPAS
jgi:hypothetical protein